MNRIALYFASGNIFFCGIILLLIGCIGRLWAKTPKWSFFERIFLIIGVILVTFSSTPLPIWLYVALGISILLVLAVNSSRAEAKIWNLRLPPMLVLAFSIMAITMEIPYHFAPILRTNPKRIIVIGDSISAGIGDEITVWPALLEDQTNIEVVNLSKPGLTIKGAIKEAEKLKPAEPENSLIILEIGGNDILSGGDSRSFNDDLDKLLSLVCGPQRKLLVFELPLPPFYNQYAGSQRKLAKKYNTMLIPRGVTARILGRPDATIDGLHLSQAGHQMMAEKLRKIIGSSNEQESTF